MNTPQLPITTDTNPYVGPRPFTEEDSDNFFGRQIESQQLTSLIIAERVVLFYAQSGAGKTSLLQASVIPRLRQFKRVVVLPISRVGGDLPPGGDGASINNIYTFNTLLNLRGEETSAFDLGGLTLSEGLGDLISADEDEGRRRTYLLILDQFEEIFTTHPDRLADRAAFFRQLQEALETYPRFSLVLAMREDFIAHLDSYVVQMHDRLRTRYRMERLGYEAALPAVTEPAGQAGRNFEEGVAEELIDNLRRIQVSRPRGFAPSQNGAEDTETTLGPYVEPVHLQIVCRQLWASLPTEATTIHTGDVQEFGDVDQALTGFYESALQDAEEATAISERNLRTWFSTQIITQARTRGLVYRGDDETEGLTNAAVDVLNNAYIIRADIRGGDTWYELTHDRLVEPILNANQAWQAAYHNPVEDGYQAWLDGGRTPDVLLKGEALQAAQVYAQANPRDITEDEQAFLTESARQEAIELELAAQAARRRRNAITAGIAVMIALSLLTVWALFSRQRAIEAEEVAVTAQNEAERSASTAAASESTAVVAREIAVTQEAVAVVEREEAERQRDRAEREARIALSRQLAAQAQNELNNQNPDLAILLGIEAVRTEDTLEAIGSLRQIMALPNPTKLYLTDHPSSVLQASWSPAEDQIATITFDESNQGLAQIWDAETGDLRTTLTGHTNWIANFDWRPDGKQLATAGLDSSIRIWDTETGEELRNFAADVRISQVLWSADANRLLIVRGDPVAQVLDVDTGKVILALAHDARVMEAHWSHDNQRILTVSLDLMARVWDAETGDLLQTFIHETPVVWGQWTEDDTAILTITTDNLGHVWDVETAEERAVLTGHEAFIRQVAWNKAGNRILSVSDDRTARIWDAETGQALLILRGHTDRLSAGGWNVDDTAILSSSWDGTARIWDAVTGETKFILTGHTDRIFQTHWNQASSRILTASRDKTVRVWNINQATKPSSESLVVLNHTDRVFQVCWNAAETLILTASADRTLYLSDAQTGEAVRQFIGHENHVLSAIWNEDESRILSWSRDNTARIWDAATGDQLLVLEGHTEIIQRAIWLLNDTQIATASTDGTIRLWDTATGEILHILEGHEGEVLSVVWDGNSNGADSHIATAGSDGIRLWSVETGEEVDFIGGHEKTVWNVRWNQDANRILSASSDNTARVWDTATGAELLVLEGHEDRVQDAYWSADESRILTISLDRTARIWDTATGETLQVLEGHVDAIRKAAWNKDERYILTASVDNTAILWDADTGQAISIYTGHQDAIEDIRWHSSETRLLTASFDGTVREFFINTEDLISAACQRAWRNMTQTEWTQTMKGNVDQAYWATCPNLGVNE